MSRIETLVAAMNQRDASLYQIMNLRTNAIIANQSDSWDYRDYQFEHGKCILVTTPERGVGRNRNQAFLKASADILLLADDDLIFFEDYPATVDKAFAERPDADLMIFSLASSPDARDLAAPVNRIKRVRMLNFMRYGAPGVAVRRASLLKANLWFSLLFGGGAPYSHGEDTLFLREALRKSLKIYVYPQAIAMVNTSNSSWFSGYHEKYFFDKGALLANVYPLARYLYIPYFALKFRSRSQIGLSAIVKSMIRGIRDFERRSI
ncbi:MAG: glycosyltransferase [Syntrophomonas sp.]